jgi:hypothetical protein
MVLFLPGFQPHGWLSREGCSHRSDSSCLSTQVLPLIIGAKGKTKQRIEQDTGARLLIPRKDTGQPSGGSEVVIRGDSRGSVARAKTQTELVISSALASNRWKLEDSVAPLVRLREWCLPRCSSCSKHAPLIASNYLCVQHDLASGSKSKTEAQPFDILWLFLLALLALLTSNQAKRAYALVPGSASIGPTKCTAPQPRLLSRHS